jgi:hypothetical protein
MPPCLVTAVQCVDIAPVAQVIEEGGHQVLLNLAESARPGRPHGIGAGGEIPERTAAGDHVKCPGCWTGGVRHEPRAAAAVAETGYPPLMVVLDRAEQRYRVVGDLIINPLVIFAAQKDQVLVDTVVGEIASPGSVRCGRDDVSLFTENGRAVGLGFLGDQDGPADRAPASGSGPEDFRVRSEIATSRGYAPCLSCYYRAAAKSAGFQVGLAWLAVLGDRRGSARDIRFAHFA